MTFLSQCAPPPPPPLKNPGYAYGQVILIAAVLVRPPYTTQLWICGLKILNLKHESR